MAAPAAIDGAARRVALVTGASRGIGAACAKALAKAGWDLALAARSAEGLDRVAQGLKQFEVKVTCIAGDALAEGSADQMVEAAMQAHSSLDALVCCAGVLKVGSLLKLSDADLDVSLGLNLAAPIRQARAAVRVMLPQGSGRIVFIASTFGFVSAASYSAYSASKAGLIGLTRALAVELAPHGIQVNAVAPGQVRTEMIVPALARFGEERMARTVPAGRIGEPEEIARAVAFLAGEAPAFLTGDVMVIDGGYLCQ